MNLLLMTFVKNIPDDASEVTRGYSINSHDCGIRPILNGLEISIYIFFK